MFLPVLGAMGKGEANAIVAFTRHMEMQGMNEMDHVQAEEIDLTLCHIWHRHHGQRAYSSAVHSISFIRD